MNPLPLIATDVTLVEALRFSHEQGQVPTAIQKTKDLWVGVDTGKGNHRWQSGSIYPFMAHQELFTRGFAWIGSSNNFLLADWPQMNRSGWNVYDISDAVFLRNHPCDVFQDFCWKRDPARIRKYSDSEVAKSCVEFINEKLESLGCSIELYNASGVNGPRLNYPAGQTLTLRMKATRIYIDAIKEFDLALDSK